MSQFFQDLWESIFIPGPTPSLLIATNVTFACLQVVLFALLLATYSIHFIILSFLSGGLWYAINWFARELQENHDREVADKARAARRTAAQTSSESETEVETVLTRSRTKAQPAPGAASGDVEVQQPGAGEVKPRASQQSQQSQGSKSSASTEDEWEKVSEYESDKTK
ncbi:putative tpa: er membrane protein [Diaporthe ampelina]|uniref:Putative tpa: er membrane protein n=1 Tax=Diaporthe ampelina TaxID=1214573 RepID=A0A0G2HQ78_9PEZI|nr:putative tpa: er membrane protein [Diaporthe ampelina]